MSFVTIDVYKRQRLNKALRELNIGLQTAVDFLENRKELDVYKRQSLRSERPCTDWLQVPPCCILQQDSCRIPLRASPCCFDQQMEGPAFKIKDDPRITRVGKFIRKTSLDELPQFYNILIGNMSLVGTRPPTIDEFKQYDLYYRCLLYTSRCV